MQQMVLVVSGAQPEVRNCNFAKTLLGELVRVHSKTNILDEEFLHLQRELDLHVGTCEG